ncbi:MAG TPA: CDP-diacylglycerol--serine O-phosphatidyltransferase [Bacteroides sp.]|nr:CDP-diacylglycerol--serine O-phosphatidyltransferase [Bacteroides sp.]
MRRHIPNLLTLLNLVCGTTALVFTMQGQWKIAVYLLLAASLLDFLDGFLARLLGAYSETGKQLDSLADMVTFGVVPTLFIYLIFQRLFSAPAAGGYSPAQFLQWIILGSALLVPVFSAIRLARFNLQENGTAFFRGLPTPAHALFWTGLFWQFMQKGLIYGSHVNVFFLWAIMLLMAFYMILPVPMLPLKFDHFRLRGNVARYLLVLAAAIILLLTGLPGLSLVVLTYILISLLNILIRLRVNR